MKRKKFVVREYSLDAYRSPRSYQEMEFETEKEALEYLETVPKYKSEYYIKEFK